MAIRHALLYRIECWLVKKSVERKMNVAEMRMLSWMFGHTRINIIRNQELRERQGSPFCEQSCVKTGQVGFDI